MEFAGGDKPASELTKDVDSEEMQAYKQALAELLKAVSVVQYIGKSLTHFD